MVERPTRGWNTGYEDYPDGTIHKMSIVDNDLRDLKAAIETAMSADHYPMDSNTSGQHKNGSAAPWIVAAATTITSSDAEEHRYIMGWAEDTGHIYLSHDLATPGTFVWNDMGLMWGAENRTWLVTATDSEQELTAVYATPDAIVDLNETITIPDDGIDYEIVVEAWLRVYTDGQSTGFLLIETEDVDGVDTGPTVTTRDENVARTEGGRDIDNVHLIWVQPTVLNSVAGTKYKFEVKGWSEVGSGNAAKVNPIESAESVQLWSKMKVRLQPRLT